MTTRSCHTYVPRPRRPRSASTRTFSAGMTDRHLERAWRSQELWTISLGAMEAAGLSEYRNLGPSGEEWPDVWLEGPDGKRTPCEVTELVDQHALPSGQARPWTASQLVDQLQAKLRTKGLRSLGGSQGDKSILVIHTDE